MRSMAIHSIATLLVLASGCYLSHGRPVDGGAVDARTVDAGPAVDAGPLGCGAVSPGADDPPVIAPHSHPRPPATDDVALVVAGDPIALVDTPDDVGGPPSILWNGTGWGAAWRGRFRALDADGAPLAPSTGILGLGWLHSIDYAEGRYALAADTRTGFFVLDASGRMVSGPVSMPSAQTIDVARIAPSHLWASAIESGATSHSRIDVYTFCDDARSAGPALALEEMASIHDVRIAALGGRAVTAWSSATGVWATVIGGAPLSALTERRRVLPRGSREIETEVYRDRVLVGGVDDEQAVVASINPWTQEIAGPFVAGDTVSIEHGRMGIAPVSEHGFYVACFGSSGGVERFHEVSLQVMGDDGSRWGAPLPLVSDVDHIGGVDCGWNGHEIVVIWWIVGTRTEIWSQRVRPTFL